MIKIPYSTLQLEPVSPQDSDSHPCTHLTYRLLRCELPQIELDVTMAELAQAQSILKETLDKVAALEAQFDEANTKKVRQWSQRCTGGGVHGGGSYNC